MKRKLLYECVERAYEYLTKHPQYNCYKHYSFIIQNNKIVGFGMNRVGTPLTIYKDHCKIHSETDAYFQVKGIMDKAEFDVVNIRMDKQGSLKNSKPCLCCYNFLKNCGCRNIWFSNEIGFLKLV